MNHEETTRRKVSFSRRRRTSTHDTLDLEVLTKCNVQVPCTAVRNASPSSGHDTGCDYAEEKKRRRRQDEASKHNMGTHKVSLALKWRAVVLDLTCVRVPV